MRVLFLTPIFPYPPSSGGAIKTWTVLEFLRTQYDVHPVCFNAAPFSEEQEAYARSFEGKLECVSLNRRRSFANLIRSYAAGVPLGVYRNQSLLMANLVSDRLRSGRFDAVFSDHWLMAQYLPTDFNGKTVLHLHNAEHVIWRRQAELDANPVRRFAARLEARRVAAYERQIADRFDYVFVVGDADREALIALGAPAGRLSLLPNVPDPRLLVAPPLSYADSPQNVLYLGTLSWQPNLEGLRALLRDFAPFRELLRDSRLIVAGSGPPGWLLNVAAAEPSVDIVTPVLHAEDLYQRARVFVEPVRGGGGSKVKVLNAMARGLPVVSTPDGAAGLDVVDGEHLLIASGPRAIAEALARVIADEALWRKLSENGRRLIQERYRPEIAYRALADALSASATPV